METLTLTRIAYSSMGVFGQLDLDGQVLYSVERPWLDNKPIVSCIPEGRYLCRPRYFEKGGYEAVEITDVPDRSHILFHIGNTMHDVAGCIALSSRLGCLNEIWAGLDSKTAFAIFMRAFGDKRFELEIVRYAPENMSIVERPRARRSRRPAARSRKRR